MVSHPPDHVTGFLARMMDVLIGIFGVSAAGPNGILSDYGTEISTFKWAEHPKIFPKIVN